MFKLGYIMATKERPQAVDAFLKAVQNYLEENNIAIYLLDGSKDSETKQIIKKYPLHNLFYFYEPDTSMAYRTIKCLEIADCEYICISGDTRIPILEDIKYLFSLMEKQYTMLIFHGMQRGDNNKKVYNSIEELFINHSWQTILYGSTFIRRLDYQIISYDKFKRKYGDNVFFHLLFYFNFYIYDRPFKGYYENRKVYREFSGRKDSFWRNRNEFAQIWFRDFVLAADVIKEPCGQYGDILLRKQATYQLHLNNPLGFIRIRSDGCFDSEIFYNYQSDIRRLTNLNMKIIEDIANMSLPFAKLIYRTMYITMQVNSKFMPKKIKRFIRKLFVKQKY